MEYSLRSAAISLLLLCGISTAAAEPGPISFEGKVIKLLLPTTSGGGTDITARLFSRFMSKYLPGAPTIVFQHMPSGQGVSALNYFYKHVKPDGTTFLLASDSHVDPMTFRSPQAQYDPTKFEIVGGHYPGDSVIVIRVDALPKLLDKSRPPVIMGSITGTPRSSMRMNIWGQVALGWNSKWVSGYGGGPDLALALARGEIDMTAFPRFYIKDKLLDENTYKVLFVDGLNPKAIPSGRADADRAPKFVDAMEGKIADPQILAAYNYWLAARQMKWIALPPGTPVEIRDAFRDAFEKTVADPEFVEQGRAVMDGSVPLTAQETEQAIRQVGMTSNETIETMNSLLPKP